MQTKLGTVSSADTGWPVKDLKILGGPDLITGEKFYYYGQVRNDRKTPPKSVFTTVATLLATMPTIVDDPDVFVYLITRNKVGEIQVWKTHVEDLDDGFPILFVNNEVPGATFGSSWESDDGM